MANERNKILPYALSAIEGVNIQSQEDYSASSETTDGVSTGLANGNNFNKLAKQVSIMSSSLAEFIVNTLAEQTISDTNSIEEISSALNSAILKLIKDNEQVIPDKAGITVIDANSTDITSFNQITEDGIYYIYKQLSDGPSQNGEAIKYNFIYLIVINVSVSFQNFEMCIQMTSFSTFPYYPMPGNIGSMPMVRGYNKTSQLWEDWELRHGIPFINNNIVISDFAQDKSRIQFPIIATDNTFPNSYNTFMYSATKEQMRAQLGIADSPDLTDYFNKKIDKLDLGTQVTGQLKNSNIADNAITTSKIANNAVDNSAIANGAVTDSKLSGVVSISHGGTGRNDGISTGVADNKLITEDNWQDEAKRGMSILYWQTADIASKKLPYTAGAMIRNYFVSHLKSALAFDLSNAYVSIFDFKQNKWKQLAFNDDVVSKMPKVSKTSGVGYLQQVAGQGLPVTYRLPSDGTYFYFLTCTNDYNNYNAADNKAGFAEGGSEIISASMNKKTFGGFIWRIQ